jgi:RNA polymerase sigma factor (TIGR02999 family)
MALAAPCPPVTHEATPRDAGRPGTPESSTDTITRLLADIRGGKDVAREELLPMVYAELHHIAERFMRSQKPGHTLQTTALVNEALLKVFRDEHDTWENRAHFLAFASHAMRSVLVDCARAKTRVKRDPVGKRVALEELVSTYEARSIDLLGLDEALARLGERDPRLVSLVELRFFGGRTMPETAEILGVSLRTAEREWKSARAWLKAELG